MTKRHNDYAGKLTFIKWKGNIKEKRITVKAQLKTKQEKPYKENKIRDFGFFTIIIKVKNLKK